MAGYSKRSLVAKLGIKEKFRLCILGAPSNYHSLLGKLPYNVTVVRTPRSGLDFLHFFTKERDELERKFPALKRNLSLSGMLWISWPKGASKIPTDLTEGVVRDIGLRNGLVDIKVCAIDNVWSGLKFMYRIKDRK